MSEAVISVRASETGASAFAVRIEAGPHRLTGDEPVAMGGADLGPAPYQMLAAALAECTTMTVRWYARQHDWPVDHVATDVTHEKGPVEGRPGMVDIFRKAVAIEGAELTGDQRAKLLEIAAKCPVHRTLEGAATISTAAA